MGSVTYVNEIDLDSGNVLFQRDMYSVSAFSSANVIGDFNGDNIPDLAWADLNANYTDKLEEEYYHFGRIYILFGRKGGFDSMPDFEDISPREGITIWGPGPKAGCSEDICHHEAIHMRVYSGDVNADGVDDLIVSSPTVSTNKDGNTQEFNGRVNVVFGTNNTWSASIDLSNQSTFDGYTFWPQTDTSNIFGNRLVVGDFNNDSINDLAVSEQADSNSDGTIYILYGNTASDSANITVTEIDGTNGIVIQGKDDDIMHSVFLDKGDINGDGIVDLIVILQSKIYIIYGNQTASSPFRLRDLDGSNGFEVVDSNTRPHPYSVTVGDFSNDGIEDLAFSDAKYNDSDNDPIGAVWVLFGDPNRGSGSLNASSLNGNNGFIITGANRNPFFIALNKGDFNGDGIIDLSIAFYNPTASEKAYIVFGSKGPFNASYSLKSGLPNGTNGVALVSSAGSAIYYMRAGDYNADGIADLMLYYYYDGMIVVVFGRPHFSSQLDIDSLSGINGFLVLPEDRPVDNFIIPCTLLAGADFDDDGYMDLLFDWIVTDKPQKYIVTKILLTSPPKCLSGNSAPKYQVSHFALEDLVLDASDFYALSMSCYPLYTYGDISYSWSCTEASTGNPCSDLHNNTLILTPQRPQGADN